MEPVKSKGDNPILLGQGEVIEPAKEEIYLGGYQFANLVELHKNGILQEANRLFFHPLGLAMVWRLPTDANDDTVPEIVGLATTDDPEGWAFTDLSQPEHVDNERSVNELRQRFSVDRTRLFGSEIQPIGNKLED